VRLALGLVVALAIARPAAASPRDFTGEARAVYAVAACGAPAPARYDARMVGDHCRALARLVARWRTGWFAKASPWFAKELASGYPSAVVYPFGGGDLVTMLAVYPEATEYTSLSLEGIGDPRPLAKLDREQLARNLGKLRTMLVANLGWAWNTTDQLQDDSKDSGEGIPGILTTALVAFDVHGYEPISVRYFELGADGTLRYVTQDAVDRWDGRDKRRRRTRVHEVERGLFGDVEIVFRKKGAPDAPPKTFRHLAADLSDAGLAATPGPLAYLRKRAELAALTKAASYLLWKPEFGTLRSLLLSRVKVMISDDTGIPPRYARPAGFILEPHGRYTGAFFAWARGDVEQEMIALWKTSSDRVPFRFGYYDSKRAPHLLVTRAASDHRATQP